MHVLGHNLQCVIHMKETDNWKGFATWFSLNKFLPKATVIVVMDSIAEQPFEYLQWAKRLMLPHTIRHKIRQDSVHNRLDAILSLTLENNKSLLVVTPNVLATKTLDEVGGDFLFDDEGLYIENFNKENLEKITNDYLLLDIEPHKETFINNVKDTKVHNLVSIKNGCGTWKESVNCPFANTAKFKTSELTINEENVLSLWNEMIIPYTVYN